MVIWPWQSNLLFNLLFHSYFPVLGSRTTEAVLVVLNMTGSHILMLLFDEFISNNISVHTPGRDMVTGSEITYSGFAATERAAQTLPIFCSASAATKWTKLCLSRDAITKTLLTHQLFLLSPVWPTHVHRRSITLLSHVEHSLEGQSSFRGRDIAIGWFPSPTMVTILMVFIA